jgi:hypothetical protein
MLLAVDGALAGAPPKYGHYTGTVRVAKTWPTIGTTRSAAAVKAIYAEYLMPPLTGYVTLQYRPSPYLEDFWSENLTNAVYISNMDANGEADVNYSRSGEMIGGVLTGRPKSMVIKLSRAGDPGHPAVEIVISLTLVKPD